MTTTTTVEWGIDYRDGYGVHPAENQWRAETWAKLWNAHREEKPPATVMRRTVTITEWRVHE